ncbi:MAG TPA: hypothetical protein DDW52_26970 [Planctomycetaceae bacterium]|nr:hypothetical protein [Planctomycetaceae bacterium]
MKDGTTEKLKFKKLKLRLGLAEWQLVGLLETLWKFTRQNCPQGDIGRFSDEDIAVSIEYSDDATELIAALTDCGWLERDDEFRLVVHDWSEHAPTFIKGCLRRHKREFADEIIRSRQNRAAESNHEDATPANGQQEDTGDVGQPTEHAEQVVDDAQQPAVVVEQVTGDAEQPTEGVQQPADQLEQPPTKPNLTKPNLSMSAGEAAEGGRSFEDFWEQYPQRTTEGGRKVRGHKGSAERRWAKLTDREKQLAFRGCKIYAESKQMPMDAVRWLHGKHWTTWLQSEEAASKVPPDEVQLPRAADLKRDLPRIKPKLAGLR